MPLLGGLFATQKEVFMKREVIIQAAATITAGILANPASASLIINNNNWDYQQIITNAIQNTIAAVLNAGIIIED